MAEAFICDYIRTPIGHFGVGQGIAIALEAV